MMKTNCWKHLGLGLWVVVLLSFVPDNFQSLAGQPHPKKLKPLQKIIDQKPLTNKPIQIEKLHGIAIGSVESVQSVGGYGNEGNTMVKTKLIVYNREKQISASDDYYIHVSIMRLGESFDGDSSRFGVRIPIQSAMNRGSAMPLEFVWKVVNRESVLNYYYEICADLVTNRHYKMELSASRQHYAGHDYWNAKNNCNTIKLYQPEGGIKYDFPLVPSVTQGDTAVPTLKTDPTLRG